MIHFRLVAAVILLCSYLIIPGSYSISFGQESRPKKEDKETHSNTRGLSLQFYPGTLLDESLIDVVSRNDIKPYMDKKSRDALAQRQSEKKDTIYMNKRFGDRDHQPIIDMVWFIQPGIWDDSKKAVEGVKQEIKTIIDRLSGKASLKIGVYFGSNNLFRHSDFQDYSDQLGHEFSQFGYVSDPPQLLLENAYLWITYAPLHDNPYGKGYVVNNSQGSREDKRTGFFRDNPKNIKQNIYKKIFVFVTSDDSRRYDQPFFEDWLYGEWDYQGGYGYHADRHDYQNAYFFTKWIFRSVLGALGTRRLGVEEKYYDPSMSVKPFDYTLFQDDEDLISSKDKTGKMDYLKNKAWNRFNGSATGSFSRSTSRNNYKGVLTLKHNDFIDAMIGKKEDYNRNEPVWKVMFPPENNAQKAEYLKAFEDFKNKKKNKDETLLKSKKIEKIDVWSFVYNGVVPKDNLVSCSTPPPPPPFLLLLFFFYFFFFFYYLLLSITFHI
ncbi:MAG: hypothetical protein OXC44_05465, partial [Proteobacteria bacterium]|nr:hypothetical protein [Pseudomonadota bacterium]